MVEKTSRDGKEAYVCTECGFAYADRKWAAECEAWCKKHKSCNIEIIKHAMKPD